MDPSDLIWMIQIGILAERVVDSIISHHVQRDWRKVTADPSAGRPQPQISHRVRKMLAQERLSRQGSWGVPNSGNLVA
jgi:hypothetical protein